MLSTNSWHTENSIFSHSTWTLSHNSNIPFGAVSYPWSLLFRCAHRCSIGLIRGLCWPCQDLHLIFLEPGLGLLALMLGVIILLENNVNWLLFEIPDAGLQLILQNLDIKIPIHPFINLACISNSTPHHTSIREPPPNFTVPLTVL